MTKIQSPKLPPQLDDISDPHLHAELQLEDVRITGLDSMSMATPNVSFDECQLVRPVFAQSWLEKLSFMDCAIVGGDFSATRCDSMSAIRVRFSDGRMTGFDASRGLFKDVTFSCCKLDMTNFRFAQLTRVRFVDCVLTQADFQGAKLQDVWFENCLLERVEWSGAHVKQVDVRTSHLIDIRGWNSLKGLIIDEVQLTVIAPQLATEIGLVIED